MRSFLSTRTRRFIVFGFDMFAIGLAFVGAFLLRFDFHIPPGTLEVMLKGLPWIYAIQATVFVSQGLYRGLWSFASLRDLVLIFRAVALAVGISVVALAFFWNHLVGWPRSVFLLDGFLLVLILGGGRFAYRFGREAVWSLKQKQKKILIVGAGHSANLIAREFSSRPELSAGVVGFLDDNPQLKRVRIQGAAVLGSINELTKWLDKLLPNEVIIAVPSLAGHKVKAILNACRDREIPCRICPPIRDVLLGKVELNQLREVRVEDLLRRDVVVVDDGALGDFLKGRRILITGAGGSIGSELCRQVLKYEPATLVLYERSEFNLYRFEQELTRSQRSGSADLAFVIGDVLNQNRLQATFAKYQPEIVIHAAAYKHVPLMEENVYEALRNNVCGTYQVLKTATDSGAKNFILVSTDKAVRPSSVMGATKRMAELVTQQFGNSEKLQTVAVRFGNVLDSEGSVLPLFRDQIANGGPVTVTHPDVTRYFMTIPEASQLVLQAAVLGNGGEVFLLDMGDPVRISELAEELIKLSGLRPGVDIEISYTGLRKGEKLYEELLINMNEARRTAHPKIMLSTGEHKAGSLPANWNEPVMRLLNSAEIPADSELRSWIYNWVPEYCPPKIDTSCPTEIPSEATHLLH